MANDKPSIIDLRKADSDADTDADADGEETGETGPNVYEEARDDYPGGVEDNDSSGDPDEERKDPSGQAREEYPEDAEEPAESEGESTSKAFSLKEFNITTKFAEDKGFGDLKDGNLVLIDTPLDGAKVGEVVGKEESWTGTLHIKVDTGANQYEITPYEDEFSERFIACIDSEGEVTPEILQRLGKTTVQDVDVGNQVMIDVPKAGPVRGTVAHKAETETQGTKVDVSTGPATFSIYEEPSPTQSKEQPILIGRVQ